MRSTTNSKGADRQHLYTISEAAAFLGVSVNTVKEWRKLGKFPKRWDFTANGWDLWAAHQLRAFAKKRIQDKTT